MPVQERRRVKGALDALQDVVGGRRLPAAPRVQHRRQRVGLVGAPALPLRRPLGCRETLGPVVGRRRRRTPHAGAAPAAAGCWTAKPYPARSRPYAHTLPQLPGQLRKVLRTPALPGPVTVLSAFSASRRRPARSSKEGRHGQHAIPARPRSAVSWSAVWTPTRTCTSPPSSTPTRWRWAPSRSPPPGPASSAVRRHRQRISARLLHGS